MYRRCMGSIPTRMLAGIDSGRLSAVLFIYLFIYCHLYSAFSIVQCSNALYRL